MKRHPSRWVLVDRHSYQRRGVINEARQRIDEQRRFRQLDHWFEADSIKAILAIYVDDFIGFACCQEVNDCLMKRVCSEWKASEPDSLKEDGAELLFVGIRIMRTSSGYVFHQTSYAREAVNRYGGDVRPRTIPCDRVTHYSICTSTSNQQEHFEHFCG
eukprot:528977-Amphidinium_carterae.1